MKPENSNFKFNPFHLLIFITLSVSIPSSSSSDQDKTAASSLPEFTDVTQAAGLSKFKNIQDSPEKQYIIGTVGGGCAFIDYDNDGWLDILLVGGTTIERYKRGGDQICALYKNQGDGTFIEVTRQSGLEKKGWGMGCAVADYDNDGYDDIYITCYGPNFLFRNNGDGTFADVTSTARIAGGANSWSTSAAFFDYDNDGHLDLYVCNYVKFDVCKPPERDPKNPGCLFKGVLVMCGPRGLPGEEDILYHNNGDGSFTDVTEKAGITDVKNRYYGLGVVTADYDDDGYTDIYVGNDTNFNYLYRNNGDGTFTDVGLLAGVATSEDGLEQGTMGVDLGDYDNDGYLDIITTNFSHDTNELYRNTGKGSFLDVTWPSGIGEPSWPLVGWGTSFFDYDNDGWLDLFIVNGHVYPEADSFEMGTSYYQRHLLHRNNRDGTFAEVGLRSGKALSQKYCGRGAAFGDFDNDGDIDILINNMDEAPTLLRNDGGNRNRWLKLRLVGTHSNRNSIGARIKLKANSLGQVRQVKSSGSYLSSNDMRVHFGLGQSGKVDRLEIRWPSGATQILTDLEVNKLITVTEPHRTNSNRSL